MKKKTNLLNKKRNIKEFFFETYIPLHYRQVVIYCVGEIFTVLGVVFSNESDKETIFN